MGEEEGAMAGRLVCASIFLLGLLLFGCVGPGAGEKPGGSGKFIGLLPLKKGYKTQNFKYDYAALGAGLEQGLSEVFGLPVRPLKVGEGASAPEISAAIRALGASFAVGAEVENRSLPIGDFRVANKHILNLEVFDGGTGELKARTKAIEADQKKFESYAGERGASLIYWALQGDRPLEMHPSLIISQEGRKVEVKDLAEVVLRRGPFQLEIPAGGNSRTIEAGLLATVNPYLSVVDFGKQSRFSLFPQPVAFASGSEVKPEEYPEALAVSEPQREIFPWNRFHGGGKEDGQGNLSVDPATGRALFTVRDLKLTVGAEPVARTKTPRRIYCVYYQQLKPVAEAGLTVRPGEVLRFSIFFEN